MIHFTDLRVQFADDDTPISGEIVFSHHDPLDDTVRHFAIERICTQIERGGLKPPIVEVPIDPNFAAGAMVFRGVEQHRFERITPVDMAHYPLVVAHMPGTARDFPGELLLIDGSHRYCKAWMLGWKTLRAYVLEPEEWEKFLVWVPDAYNDIQRERLSNQHINPMNSRIK